MIQVRLYVETHRGRKYLAQTYTLDDGTVMLRFSMFAEDARKFASLLDLRKGKRALRNLGLEPREETA